MLPPAQVPGGVPSSNAAHRPTQPRLLPALPQPDALLTGFERDIHKLIDIFAEGVSAGAGAADEQASHCMRRQPPLMAVALPPSSHAVCWHASMCTVKVCYFLCWHPNTSGAC